MVFSLTTLEVLAVQSCSSRLNDVVFTRILSTPCQRCAGFLRSLGGADTSVEVQTPVTLAIVCTQVHTGMVAKRLGKPFKIKYGMSEDVLSWLY